MFQINKQRFILICTNFLLKLDKNNDGYLGGEQQSQLRKISPTSVLKTTVGRIRDLLITEHVKPTTYFYIRCLT